MGPRGPANSGRARFGRGLNVMHDGTTGIKIVLAPMPGGDIDLRGAGRQQHERMAIELGQALAGRLTAVKLLRSAFKDASRSELLQLEALDGIGHFTVSQFRL